MKNFFLLLAFLLLTSVGAQAEIVSQPPGSGGGGSGTVTSVSVVTANGFSGTVSNPTTTPAITISGGASGITLGTSASATNPQRTSEAGTGLYSATDQTVSVAANSADTVDIGTTGLTVDVGNVILGSSSGEKVTTAGTSLTLSQTGDVLGGSSLLFENRTGLNGAQFSTTGVDLTDFSFKAALSGAQYNFRFEHRSAELANSGDTRGELQIIDYAASTYGAGVATFGQSAILLAPQAWDSLTSDGPNVGIGLNSPGAALDVGNSSGSAFRVAPTASEVDYIQITGGVTGNPGSATISAQGSDTNVKEILSAQGTGSIQLTSHKSYTGTAPAVSSCGTSPSIDSQATDNSGTVTVGTVAAASCTVTFNVAYTTWNHCRVTSQTTLSAFGYSYTKTAITVTGTSLVGDLFDYECDGQ